MTHAHFLCDSCYHRLMARRVRADLLQCPGCTAGMPYTELPPSRIVHKQTSDHVLIEEVDDNDEVM